MNAPLCPDHQVPMAPSQRGGGFYCKRKNQDGSWCRQKAAAAPQAPYRSQESGAATIAVPAQSGDVLARATLAAACLEYASQVGPQPNQTGPIDVAQDAYRRMALLARIS